MRTKLQNWMEANGLDDAALAERVGTDRTTISRIRRGVHDPSWSLLRRIIKESGGKVTADDFVPLPDHENDSPVSPSRRA